MQNGNGTQARENKLDDALEDSFPASDPISMTQPKHRQGEPKQHSQARESVRDAADALEKKAKSISPDYLWLGGAFVLGCVVGVAASAAPAAFTRRGYGERLMDEGSRLQRRLSKRASNLQLQKKLSELIDRLS